jgi:SAM-dependent methyltransferase
MKASVRDYYDSIGWSRVGDDVFRFADSLKFEDLRPVSSDYRTACHRRVMRYLPRTSRFLLAVASGPVQYREYAEYLNGYHSRLCVDLSMVALLEARRRLGGRGSFVIGDICRLPFKDGVIDAAVPLHTIYHWPAEEQADAFEEIHRVLLPGGSATVVYSWGAHSELMRLAMFPAKLVRRLKAVISRRSARDGPVENLYFFTYDRRWLLSRRWPFVPRLAVWRSVSVDFLRTYMHSFAFGRQFLRLLFWLEDAFPAMFGALGQYPLVVIKKDTSNND